MYTQRILSLIPCRWDTWSKPWRTFHCNGFLDRTRTGLILYSKMFLPHKCTPHWLYFVRCNRHSYFHSKIIYLDTCSLQREVGRWLPEDIASRCHGISLCRSLLDTLCKTQICQRPTPNHILSDNCMFFLRLRRLIHQDTQHNYLETFFLLDLLCHLGIRRSH